MYGKLNRLITFAAAGTIGLVAACSSGSPRPAVTVTVTVTPASKQAASATPSQKATPARKTTPAPEPAASSTAPVQTASLFCKVEQDSSSGALEYTAQASVTSGSAHVGNVLVSFYSSVPGQIFPGTELSPDTTVTPDRPWVIWQPVPPADVGASAEPVGCTASGG